MDKYFSACELVEMGIEVERNGKAFYGELKKLAENTQTADVLGYLAEQEDRHIAVFQGIFDNTCDHKPEGVYPDEYFAYIRALAGQYVFTRKGMGKEIASGVGNIKEGVELGIRFEKDSILFYEEMKKYVPEKSGYVIEKLIAEEKGHLRELCDIKGRCFNEECKSV